MSTRQTVQINIRVPDAIAAELDDLAQREQSTRIVLARQILVEGIAGRKQDAALRLYTEGKVSKARAAELAGVSLWEMMAAIDAAAVPSGYSLQEAVEDVRRLIAQAAISE